MKNVFDKKQIKNIAFNSLFPTLGTTNNYNLNSIINLNNDFFDNANKIKSKIKNDNEEGICQTTFDIGNSLSNIKRQLNNISLNERNTLKIHKTKPNKSYKEKNNYSTRVKNNLKSVFINNKNENGNQNINLIKHEISFSILNIFTSQYYKELQNENNLLKENIRFLLNQIKKKKKIELKKNIYNSSIKSGGKEKNENNMKPINNKINNVFDIINKYKKQINTLKEELNNITKENEILKDYIYNQANLLDNNNSKRKSIFNNSNSIIKKPNLKNNITLNHQIPLRNKEYSLMPYRKKTFNKTFSHFKNGTSDTYTYDNRFTIETFNKTFKNQNNNIFNTNNNFNFSSTDKNTNKKFIFNTFNSKSKHFIIIDSHFKGEEKMENKPRFSDGKIYINSSKNKSLLSPLSNELYYKKQINQSIIKKFDFNGKEFHNKTLDSIKSSKLNYDFNNINEIKIKIMKINKSNNL